MGDVIYTVYLLGFVLYLILGFVVSLFHMLLFFESGATDDWMCLFLWPLLLLHILLYLILNIVKYIKEEVIEIIRMFKEW